MSDERPLVLGVSRVGDSPSGALTGFVVRQGDRLAHLPLTEGKASLAAQAWWWVLDARGLPRQESVARLEWLHGGKPQVLVAAQAGKLAIASLAGKLLMKASDCKLVKPQPRPATEHLMDAILCFGELARIADDVSGSFFDGERSLKQLAEALSLDPKLPALGDAMWELSRRGWLNVHGEGPEGTWAPKGPLPGWGQKPPR